MLNQINGEVTEFDYFFAAQDVRGVTNAIDSFVEQLDRRNEVLHCHAKVYRVSVLFCMWHLK